MEFVPSIYVGRASSKLGALVAKELGIVVGDLDMMEFPDGEPWYCISDEPSRDIFFIQSTSQYAPKSYFDLFGMLEAASNFSAGRRIVFMPLMGFRRQERQKEKGEAVMARLMARLIATAGATDVVLCDAHSPKLLEFFKECGVRVHEIDANPLFWQVFDGVDLTDYAVLTPDLGREDVASRFARHLGVPLVQVRKTRFDGETTRSNGIIKGDVDKKHIILRDDEVSTLSTVDQTVDIVMQAGALDVTVMATHGVLVGGSVQKLKRRRHIIKEVYTTDSVYLQNEKRIDSIRVLSLAPIIARIITNMAKAK